VARAPALSRRTTWDLRESALALAVRGERARGRQLVDLTESNPIRARVPGLEELVALLGHPRGASYEPHSLGHPRARAAVSEYYASRGEHVDPSTVVLSASTSEAYGWLFEVLADPGDEVLVPRPSYPLFSYLASLADVKLVPYRLMQEERFRPDVDEIRRLTSERTRGIIVVSPNNPTGTLVGRDAAAELEAHAERSGLALVVDEVFGDYLHGEVPPGRVASFVGERAALTFVMSGLSKVLASPQLKLSWTVVLGPAALRDRALARLEVVADTFLSVSTPVQLALPELLAARPKIQGVIRARLAQNLAALDEALARHAQVGLRRLPTDGGWSVILEVPRTHDDEAWAMRLLSEEGVLVHPGYFFDMEREGHIVLSLLVHPDELAPAARRVLDRLAEG
jgi:alanine-synthesizing transaminase